MSRVQGSTEAPVVTPRGVAEEVLQQENSGIPAIVGRRSVLPPSASGGGRRVRARFPAITSFLLLGSAVAGAAPLRAQAPGYAAGAGAGYESYSFSAAEAIGVRRLSLVTLPFGARFQPRARLHFDLNGAFASGTLTRTDGTSASISGPTDTELRGSVVVVPQFMTVTVSAFLPTGRATQNEVEAEVAGRVASELLPFRITNWGSGGGAGLSTTLAIPVEGFGVGISAGYIVAREFEPSEGGAEGEAWRYRPGNTLRLRVGIDRTLSRSTKATLLLGLRQHAADGAAAGSGSGGGREQIYRPGNRYDAIGSLAYAAGRTASAISYLGVQHRGAGDFMQETLAVPAQDLILAGTQVRLPVGRGVLTPGVDARLFRRADGQNQGYLGGIGVAAEWDLGGVKMVPNLRGWAGKMNFWEGNEGSVWGSDLGLTVRFGGQAR